MAAPESSKLYQSRALPTNQLKSGDNVTGSQREELMIAPPGLYVTKVTEELDRCNEFYGCTLVWWGNSARPEAFNPYYVWYVANRCKECDEPWDESHNCSKVKEKQHGEGQDPQEG